MSVGASSVSEHVRPFSRSINNAINTRQADDHQQHFVWPGKKNGSQTMFVANVLFIVEIP